MEIQKKFEQFLKEDRTMIVRPYQAADPSFQSVDDVTVNASNVKDPEVLKKINGYLSAVSASPTINPYFVAKRIQDKLSIIGLHFDVPYFVGERGSEKKPVSQFGGVFGYKNVSEPFEKGKTGDVGFPDIGSENSIGLDIKFSWTSIKGIYTIDAQLVSGAVPKKNLAEDDLTEETLKEHDYITNAGYKFNKKVGDAQHYISDFGHKLVVKPSKKFPGKPEWWHHEAGSDSQTHGHGANKLQAHLNTLDEDNQFHPYGYKKVSLNSYVHPETGHTLDVKGKDFHHYDSAGKHLKSGKDAEVHGYLKGLHEVSPPGWSGTTKAMKKHKEITNPFALAWWMKKHGAHSHKKPE